MKREIKKRVPADFWRYVDIGDGCWLWRGSRTKAGYGQLQICGRKHYAHRYSYAMNFGAVPDGMHVLHRCDTPACVRPCHLFVGTDLDNVRDMDAKGRRINSPNPGSRNGNSKLTEAQVIAIRQKSRASTVADLATEFCVSQSLIYQIRKYTIWRHV